MYIIGGKHKKRRLISPKSQDVRPTSGQLREALFNICQFDIEGASFLDLFAGSGAVGLEALSRGASFCTFVEKSRQNGEIIKKNISLLKEEEHAQVFIMDALEALKKCIAAKKKFDIIFADPPYGTKKHSYSNEILALIDQNSLLCKNGQLFLEDSEEASNFENDLAQLKLISTRKMGPAILRQYALES